MNIAAFCSILVVASVVACGSGSAKSAKSADDDTGDSESSGDDEESSASSDIAGESAPERPRCDDGTCIECGDAICPSGYYCDEGTKPAVCAWIPACATDASCGCLGRALADCKCETRGSGAYVNCAE